MQQGALCTSDRSCSAARLDMRDSTQRTAARTITDTLLTRRGWPNGPGTEGHRIRGKKGAPQSPCYWHAIGGLSAYYLGRISTVTAIFPARIFKVSCGFFRPELSHIFLCWPAYAPLAEAESAANGQMLRAFSAGS